MNKDNDKNIVIMTYHYSIVVRGIEKNLKDEGFDTITIREDSEEIEEYAKKAGLFIVYLPEELIADSEGILVLEGVHTLLTELGKKMIVIGEKKAHDDFLKAVPDLAKHFWLNRPIEKDILIRMIRGILKAGEKEERGEREQRILIIDDDPSYAKMIREWLKEVYKINVVTTGKLVMSFLEKNEVDLILLDYEMPEMDGPEVLELIHLNPKTAEIPVVFLTGVNTKERIAQVMSLKPAGYILKSTTREELLDKLGELL